MGKHATRSSITLQGRLLATVLNDAGAIKKFRLGTAQGEWVFKVPKFYRKALAQPLQAGIWVEVQGCQVNISKKGKQQIKLEATSLVPVETCGFIDSCPAQATVEATSASAHNKPIKIKVCQKSSCCRRGGDRVWQALTDKLQVHDMANRIQLERTGCLGKCKEGPALMVLPEKHKYTSVRPHQISKLLKQYVAV